MPRYHDLWDAESQQQVRVPFTTEEETARDAEEAAVASYVPPRLEQLMASHETPGEQSELLVLLLTKLQSDPDSMSDKETLKMLQLERTP